MQNQTPEHEYIIYKWISIRRRPWDYFYSPSLLYCYITWSGNNSVIIHLSYPFVRQLFKWYPSYKPFQGTETSMGVSLLLCYSYEIFTGSRFHQFIVNKVIYLKIQTEARCHCGCEHVMISWCRHKPTV